jgi:RimJ/RimL family protein N-acetyltransferase/glycosyltransferase involved in cell wall biosynthesis
MYKTLIRPLEIEDAAISWKWRNDAKIWEFTGHRPDREITFEIENEWIQKVVKDETSKRFAITVDDQYIGNIQLTEVTKIDAQMHLFIGEKSFWGKGIARTSIYQLMHYAKEVLQLKEVYLFVKKTNLAGISSYVKSAFVEVEKNDAEIKMVCNLENLPPPIVSIFSMVYKHENYIAEAIEGFLMQKCSFNTVIVLGEDNSPDRSREVINAYAQKYPGKFKLLYHDVNVGAHKNQEIILQNCSGKYIAICEGDDYWIDDMKLQIQVDFMENNPDYAICFTDYKMYNQTTNTFEYPNLIEQYKEKSSFSRKDIVLDNFIPTLTCLFKNFPKNVQYLKKELFPGDWFIHILNSKNGKIKFLPMVSAVYRKHDGGACSSSNPITNNLRYINSIDVFRKQFSQDSSLQYWFFVSKTKIYMHSIKYKLKQILKPE